MSGTGAGTSSRSIRAARNAERRLSRRSRYDRIDRKSDSLLRRSLGLFGAPIYHCTFCRLQFRDFHGLEPNGKAKAQAQA